MHLGRIVGSSSNDSGRSLESDTKRLAEIDRRIAELEAEELETGISGKLRIEQSLKELRRERAVLLGEPLAEIEEE